MLMQVKLNKNLEWINIANKSQEEITLILKILRKQYKKVEIIRYAKQEAISND